MKIQIRKSPSADTRSADHKISMMELVDSTKMHIDDVCKALAWFSELLLRAGMKHDWTKLFYIEEFYDQFSKAQETGEWGEGWYDKIHAVEERHHLNDRCPEDVDLIDVLEQIADSVMAGLARSGEYREGDEPDAEMLQKAYRNTVRKLIENTELEES